ncbi:MAG: hypothetical protein PHY64_01475 [Eubacteriales bacterium]|nr:hypothetical protein [Eubacteriales bacterium]
MSIQSQILTALRGLIDDLGFFAPVSMGALPAEDGLSLSVSTGQADEETLSGGQTVSLDVAVACKHQNQNVAMDTLCTLQETLRRATALPAGDGWQMIAVRINGAAGYLGRDEARWLYGGGLTVVYAVEPAAD